jgi:hypothetical protein
VWSRLPDRACVVRQRTDDLLVEQYTVPDGQVTPPVKEAVNHNQY